MPNRIIKESICTSEQIDELTPFEENFFYRLLVNCDDYGCMDARGKVLAAKLYPLKVLKPKDIQNTVEKLAEIELIGLYEVDDHPYLKVLKWADHQRVRISKHKYPEPTEEQLAASRGNLRRVAASCGNLRPESNPIQSNPKKNPNPNPNTNPIQSRGKTTEDESFLKFWAEYPRKTSRPDAVKAWGKIKPDEELFVRIMNGLNKWKASYEWKQNDGQYIPYPASWLNKRRWEDEVKTANNAPVKKTTAQQYTQRDYIGTQEEAMQNMLAMMQSEGNI